MFAIVTATVLGATLLSAAPASAALLERDLLSNGDSLLTFDENTGLEWLDLSATTDLSPDEVIAGSGEFTTALGFRYATFAEIESLFAAAGIVDLLGTPTSTNGDSVFDNLTDLHSLMGVTVSSGGIDPLFAANGIYGVNNIGPGVPNAEPEPPRTGPTFPNTEPEVPNTPNIPNTPIAPILVLSSISGGPSDVASFGSTTIASSDSDSAIGSFLVREMRVDDLTPVPEPGFVLGLAVVGFAGLLGRNKRTHRSGESGKGA